MHRFLILGALVLSTSLIGPAVARADDRAEARSDDRNHHDKRYYDRNGKDYHTWNSNEDRAYRTYLQEQHRNYRDFDRVKRGQQQEYFKWRHGHDDNKLFRVEIR
jgi:hypothetical protein